MPDDIITTANKFRRALLKKERKAAMRLIAAYGLVWNRLNKSIGKIGEDIAAARAAGETVNQFWLVRQERYFLLLAQAQTEMRKFSEFSGTVITKQQSSAVKAGLTDSIALMETAASMTGAGAVFNQLPVSAVENLVGTLGDGSPLKTLLNQLPFAGRQIVEQGLIEGVALGRSPAAIAREIRAGLEGNRVRALTISRTEVLRAYRTASLQNYQANSDVVSGWYWRSSRSRRSCAACIALDGKFFPLDKPMRPHPRCIPAGAMIHAPNVEASTSRWYEGELVEFETLRGYRLSVTPNHPILTAKGWVPAGFLNKGDEVVSARFPERVMAAINPNKNHIPARIEDVASASLKEGGMFSVGMPTAPEDFHGDGLGSNVHVINVEGLLRDGYDPASFQPFGQPQFVGSGMQDFLLSSHGPLDLFFQGVDVVSGGDMGRFGISPMFFRCSRGHHQAIGFETATAPDSVLVQNAGDDIAGYVKAVGDAFLRLSDRVTANNIILRYGADEIVSQFDSGLNKQASNDLVGNAKFAHQLRTRFAGLVEIDQVREIRKMFFTGQVYNLQTNTGWYISNNIITHNCRCVMIPAVKGVKVDRGVDWFRAQPADVKRDILGTDAAYDAVKTGKLQLEDLVGVHRGGQWGESFVQIGVKRALAGEGAFPK